MKKLFKAIVFLVVGLLIGSCGQSITPTPFPVPSPTATLGSTATPVASQTAMIEPTATEGYVPPTLQPTFEPSSVPTLLHNAFSIQTLKGPNGHGLRQITGWDYGFTGYDWMDSKHLLLNVVMGQESDAIWGTESKTESAVINLETEKIWLPPTTKNEVGHYIPWDKRPRWSSKLGLLIAFTEEFIEIYTSDGNRTAHYEGNLLGISPSATKFLMAENRLIDLSTGKTIDFDWHSTDLESGDSLHYQPIWSSDENRVYRCCYHNGDVLSGESYSFTYADLETTGRKIPEYYLHSTGEWVLKNSLLLVQWDYINFSSPGFIPLFDPMAKTYYDLSELANIPAEQDGYPLCQETSVSPDEMYVWVECYTANYLVNLKNFESKVYPGEPHGVSWSAGSQFAWVYSLGDDNRLEVLSVSSKELIVLSVNPLFDTPKWHPTDDVLAYISENGQKMEVWNVSSMSAQEMTLTSVFQHLVWSPGGDRIALMAEDGSLWQVDYPTLANLEQLTPSLLNVSDVKWSPDGNSMSFVSGSDIYIVETVK